MKINIEETEYLRKINIEETEYLVFNNIEEMELLTRDDSSFKLYVSDTGLFVTMMFMDRPSTENEIYAKLLSDKLPANLGYLYENVVAQMLTAAGRELYYHTWEKENSTHYYEIDFLLSKGTKVDTMEVKSSGVGKHESLNAFRNKYSNTVGETILISQKDLKKEGNLRFVPVYMTTFLSERRNSEEQTK